MSTLDKVEQMTECTLQIRNALQRLHKAFAWVMQVPMVLARMLRWKPKTKPQAISIGVVGRHNTVRNTNTVVKLTNTDCSPDSSCTSTQNISANTNLVAAAPSSTLYVDSLKSCCLRRSYQLAHPVAPRYQVLLQLWQHQQ